VLTLFVGVQVHLRNGCLPATPSALMEMCLEQSVDADVDLLFIEYVANDGANRCGSTAGCQPAFAWRHPRAVNAVVRHTYSRQLMVQLQPHCRKAKQLHVLLMVKTTLCLLLLVVPVTCTVQV
jgi:hypothetical protein